MISLLPNFSFNISGEYILIFFLFIYIIYLQLQIARKNNLLKSFYDKVDKPDSKLEKKDIIRFLENIKNPEFSGIVTKDRLLDKKIRNFLFENDDNIKLFLHYTASEDVANKILKEGFHFVNSFYKTAEYIYNDELYLVHRHHEHKQFGKYVILICISKDIYTRYSNELSNLKAKNIAVEQILTETPPYVDENSDEIYTFPKQFIKGYFNYMEGTIVKNPEFDFNYISEVFNENMDKLKPDKN
ncbi:MAG: hypothetical protein KOO66_01285 [Bacteroidales bacterium]|nr:hypothetical protein [Bacteroidales bacterium]